MLTLAFQLRLRSGPIRLPQHLGGALHGFIEGAAKAHAPHLLPMLRPRGLNTTASFVIHCPRFASAVGDRLDFKVVLFGDASQAWAVLLRAVIEQIAQRIHGREACVDSAFLLEPGVQPLPVVEDGRLVDPLPQPESPSAWLRRFGSPIPDAEPSALHYLELLSPLLVASRSASRTRIKTEGRLPWPTLGQLLNSIAYRMLALEPELVQALDVGPLWKASFAQTGIEPLISTSKPCAQVAWDYSSTPRRAEGEPREQAHRSMRVPGIVGMLVYPASGCTVERNLLHWGQWIGVGQKTTMGCGAYQLAT